MAGIISNEERHVIAASHHLLRALQSTNLLSNDVRRLVVDLDIHLSTMMRVNDEEEEETNGEIERKLLSSRHTITSLHSKTWHSNPVILVEYLQAVGEVQRLVATLENMPLSRSRELFDCAQSVVQMAMDRLQSELILTLVQNKQCELEYVMDLIHPDVIPQIKSIADTMFTSGYSQEFCQSFTGFWRDTFSDHLSNILANEHLSVEDVLHMEWKSLNSRIRKWRVAMKSMIGCYLGSAKCLFDQVLGGYSSSCLLEASRAQILSLLNFGQAVAIGPHKPEWLFCLLNMYEVLCALEPDVDALFETEGSLIRIEFQELLTRIQDSIKAIFKHLGNHIATCSSATPFTTGGIHHLTKYVVNYILCLAEYGNLDFLLPNPVEAYLQSLTSILETNIEKRSSLYTDCALKHIFLMNNIHYMVQKISNSRMRPYFGDDWIRDHVVKYRQHAMWYERVTWSSIIMLLRDDDGKNGKATLKARCRDFGAAFEQLYKNQTKWVVPDLQLREEVRISASKILQAYRNFVKKITNSIGEKHIKYSEQELGTYILDLLEGSSKSLNHSRKR
ncbi:hypothetical protein ACS0TY_034642 [Phlomoides rotata]